MSAEELKPIADFCGSPSKDGIRTGDEDDDVFREDNSLRTSQGNGRRVTNREITTRECEMPLPGPTLRKKSSVVLSPQSLYVKVGRSNNRGRGSSLSY